MPCVSCVKRRNVNYTRFGFSTYLVFEAFELRDCSSKPSRSFHHKAIFRRVARDAINTTCQRAKKNSGRSTVITSIFRSLAILFTVRLSQKSGQSSLCDFLSEKLLRCDTFQEAIHQNTSLMRCLLPS